MITVEKKIENLHETLSDIRLEENNLCETLRKCIKHEETISTKQLLNKYKSIVKKYFVCMNIFHDLEERLIDISTDDYYLEKMVNILNSLGYKLYDLLCYKKSSLDRLCNYISCKLKNYNDVAVIYDVPLFEDNKKVKNLDISYILEWVTEYCNEENDILYLLDEEIYSYFREFVETLTEVIIHGPIMHCVYAPPSFRSADFWF